MSATSSSTDSRCGYRGRGQRQPWHPVELIAMILGFMIFWPIGLAILALKMWQRKTGEPGDLASMARNAYARSEDWAQNATRGWSSGGSAWARNAASTAQGFASGQGFGMGRTGNSAFDDWRASELAKLEEERKRLADAEREFADHIEGLRRSRDREEFDRFMAARSTVTRTEPGS